MGKRLWQYPEVTNIDSDDFLLLDNESEGSKCIKANKIGAVLIDKTVTERKTYTASDDNVNGYKKVIVDVPYTDVHYDKDDIVSFTGEDFPLKSLTAYITALQEGSGDPSPTNIRPIIGWSAVDVTIQDDIDNPTTTETITIQLGDTYYGGKLDVVSGVLTVDRASVTVDENSNIISGSGGLPFRIDLLTGAKTSPSASALTGVKCNFLKEVTQSSSWGVDGTFSRVTTDAKIVYFKVNSEITTIQQLKTFLQSNNLQFVYELATPLTYQLSKQQIRSLVGENNIFADTGEVSVEWQTLYQTPSE